MKKYLKSMLAIVLAIMIFMPLVVLADETEITEITVNVPTAAPANGADIIDEFSVPEGANYEPASWINGGKMRVHLYNDGYNYESGKYGPGEKYVWSVIVCPKEGYAFPEELNDVHFTVNGINIDDKNIVEGYGTSINGGTCRGISIRFKQTDGVAPAFVTKPDSTIDAGINTRPELSFSFSIDETIVLQEKVNGVWTDINTFTVTANEVQNFMLPEKSTVGSVYYRLKYEKDGKTKYAEFTINWIDYSKILTSFEVNLPAIPSIGKDIVKEFSVPEGVNYEPVTWHDGMFVYNITDGTTEVTGQYQEGIEYRWSAIVCPKEGYSFTSDFNALTYKVNGINVTSEVIKSIGKTVNATTCRGVEIRFKALEERVVETPVVTLSVDNNKVILSWENQTYAEKYAIYRSLDNKKYTKVATVSENSYEDKGLTYNKKYYYKVRAYDGEKWTAYSKEVSKKILPNKVTNLTVKSGGTKNINLTWDKVSVNGYEVYSSI